MFERIYNEGMSISQFYSIATPSEVKKMSLLKETLELSDDIKNKILNINEDKHLLLCAESWCPYVRALLSTLETMRELNDHIKVSIITFGRGMVYVIDRVGIREDDYVIPLLISLDNKFEEKGKYVGYPKKYLKAGFDKVKTDFFEGKKADDIASGLLEIF